MFILLRSYTQWADELGTRPGMEAITFNAGNVGFTKTEGRNRITADIRGKHTAADAAGVAIANQIGEF